jgi:hypothetical protein
LREDDVVKNVKKPVPCPVCGKSAATESITGDGYCVVSSGDKPHEHYMLVGYFPTKAAAVAAWNRAMGKRKRKIAKGG